MSEYPIPDRHCPHCRKFLRIPKVIYWRATPNSAARSIAKGRAGFICHPVYEIVTKGTCTRCGRVPLQIIGWGEEVEA